MTGIASVSTWDDLLYQIKQHNGWKLNFSREGERNIGQAALLASTLTFTTYVPSTDICTFEGNSYLYGLYYITGTPYFNSILGFDNVVINSKKKKKMYSNVALGLGLAATPNIHVGGEEGSKVFVQTSTGAINVINEQNVGPTKSGIRSWRVDEQ